jgi:2-keto-4-pentenoate hydratase/2-oxohepta-3-ene-1,7-dioic acid hydratase in catechol pathway
MSCPLRGARVRPLPPARPEEQFFVANDATDFTSGRHCVDGGGHAIPRLPFERRLKAASTADLGWKVDEILVFLTSFMTLHPGDLVLTGFPAESAPIVPGNTVTCCVQGIGELSNPVEAAV